MKTARSHSVRRQAAQGALLSLALLTSAASAAALGAQAAAPMTAVGLNQALQTLTTVASADVAIGGEVSDTATLAATEGPGSLSFSLYGPNDDTCENAPAFTVGPVAAPGDGSYPSGPVTPTVAGTYHWVAEYTDQNGRTIATSCDDEAEEVVVTQAVPTLTTVASPGVPVGGTATDTATLAGGFEPTGTITFRLFGPGDDVCEAAPVFVDEVDVDSGNDDYTSAASGPLTTAGTYHWTAFYAGDANNAAIGTVCNEPSENVVVGALATPSLVTNASDDVDLGGSISDTATLADGDDPTGTITFTLYGPDDATCAGEPLVTDGVTVDAGNGSYTSAGITPTAPGTYRWIAAYSGDANNAPAATACNDENESVVVRAVPVTPTLVTEASRDTYVGKRVHDTATLAGGEDPTGTITFTLYGPDDATCSRTPVFTSTVPVDDNGQYRSGAFRPYQPGTYQWVAAYSGDENNEAVSTDCGDPAEQVVVRRKGPYGGSPRP
ncbi:hypothetical protein [Catellatospora methionotrophica]|uniref:hypothetical protein n=1 Tax=Catellatospora methionotrophica TaxID=121620 RepID=UPI00340233E1